MQATILHCAPPLRHWDLSCNCWNLESSRFLRVKSSTCIEIISSLRDPSFVGVRHLFISHHQVARELTSDGSCWSSDSRFSHCIHVCCLHAAIGGAPILAEPSNVKQPGVMAILLCIAFTFVSMRFCAADSTIYPKQGRYDTLLKLLYCIFLYDLCELQFLDTCA